MESGLSSTCSHCVCQRFASEHRNKTKSPLTRTAPHRLMVLPLVGLPLSPAKKSSAGFGKRVAPAHRRKFRHRSCIRWNISVIRTSDPLSYLFCLLLSFSLWCLIAAPRHSSRQFFLLAAATKGLPRLEAGCAADLLPPCVVRKSSDRS